MKKLLFFLCLFFAISVSAQKLEHGALIGGSIGFPMQDKGESVTPPSDNMSYNHDLKGGGLLGYRFRFLPVSKSFFDVDVTMGFQGMSTYKYSPYYESDENGNFSDENGNFATGKDGKSFSEFIMPISLSASWNYKFTDKFHAGVGVAPTLYVQPQAVFDLAVLAKVGYRVSKHCELGLTYQYGCLDVMKHFNEGPALGRRGHFSDLMLSVYIPFVIK